MIFLNLNPKLKGNYYVKHVNEILNGNLTNKYIIPITNSKNKLYSIKNDESKIFETNLDDIPNENFDRLDNEEEILKYVNIEKISEKGGRFNYSYQTEMNIYNEYMNVYKNNSNMVNIKPKNDIFVFRNCFNTECFYYNKSKLSNANIFDKHHVSSDLYTNSDRDGPLIKGDEISISGFIRLPRNYLNVKRFNIDNLQDIIQSSYNYNDLYNNIKTYNLENVNFNLEKDKRVKLCFNIDDDKTNIEGYIEDINESTIFIKPINF